MQTLYKTGKFPTSFSFSELFMHFAGKRIRLHDENIKHERKTLMNFHSRGPSLLNEIRVNAKNPYDYSTAVENS